MQKSDPEHGLPVTIRAAAPADLVTLTELDREAFGDHAYSAATIRQLMELFPQLLVLAEDDQGHALGHGFGGLGAEADIGWVLAFAVRPQVRGRGVAGVLGRALLDRLAEVGASRVRSTCAPESAAVLAFQRHMGFSPLEEVRDYFGPGRHRIVLERRL